MITFIPKEIKILKELSESDAHADEK